ncbi:MAG: hypothetical protein GTN81_14820 [Proteobacteria bacterium]|nr:hypothetical protein [Pseudomonadota bacterium]
MSLEEARREKKTHCHSILNKKNVVACGVGTKMTGGKVSDEPCVVVSVIKKLPPDQLEVPDLVPQTVGTARTDVVETGTIRAFQSPTEKWRPAPGGVSIGHFNITAGTLGCLVTRGSDVFILSNNHVLADSNQGQAGDAILQPGSHDGGTNNDRIAVLEEFVPINFGTASPTCGLAKTVATVLNGLARVVGSSHRLASYRQVDEPNRVDAAIAHPLSSDLVERRILEIGVPKGSREAGLGTRIKKSGRTTGFTTSEISQIDATVRVSYGSAGTATFEDQYVAGAMSAGGDSGSAVLDEEDFVIGLLFAGSDSTTIINPIQYVLQALNAAIAT